MVRKFRLDNNNNNNFIYPLFRNSRNKRNFLEGSPTFPTKISQWKTCLLFAILHRHLGIFGLFRSIVFYNSVNDEIAIPNGTFHQAFLLTICTTVDERVSLCKWWSTNVSYMYTAMQQSFQQVNNCLQRIINSHYLLYRPFLETPSGTISPLTTPVPGPPKPLTSRQQVAMELLQTERNYVQILTNILKVLEWLRLAWRLALW